jgi:hypothetical protein
MILRDVFEQHVRTCGLAAVDGLGEAAETVCVCVCVCPPGLRGRAHVA